MDARQDEPPFDLPSPRLMADTLMARAWDDDTADCERLLLEQGALTITHLLTRLAVATEHAEARTTNTRR
jgi:hypothetical protein